MKGNECTDTWELDSLLKGSGELTELIAQTKVGIEECLERVETLDLATAQDNKEQVAIVLRDIGCIQNALSQMSSFVTCLLAENPGNQTGISLQGTISSVKAGFSSLVKKLQHQLAELDPATWDLLLQTESLKDYRFIINEWRTDADAALSNEEEALIADLMIDGDHAWNDLYRSILNNLRVNRSEEHTSELQSPVPISYAVFCLKKKNRQQKAQPHPLQSHAQLTQFS